MKYLVKIKEFETQRISTLDISAASTSEAIEKLSFSYEDEETEFSFIGYYKRENELRRFKEVEVWKISNAGLRFEIIRKEYPFLQRKKREEYKKKKEPEVNTLLKETEDKEDKETEDKAVKIDMLCEPSRIYYEEEMMWEGLEKEMMDSIEKLKYEGES